MRGAAVSAIAVLAASGAATAADLPVGPGQTFATIQAAVDAARPGDVVVVQSGEYQETLALAASGTVDLPLTVTAADGATVVLRGAVEIDGDYWRVMDLTIVVPPGLRGVEIGGDHNVLSRLDLSGGDRNGIDGGGIGNEVRESSIHDFDAGDQDAHCIVLNPQARDWVIADNDLRDCSGDCVQLYAPSGTAPRDIVNTRIERNVMSWTGAIARMENAIDVKNADGLYIEHNRMSGFVENKTVVFQKGPANIEVRCNVMSGGFTGVEFRGEDGIVETITFERNLLHDFTDYALKFDGVLGASVVSNTFVDAASDGLRIEGAGLTGGQVRNNLWVRTGNLDAGRFDADHNGYFEVGSPDIASPTDVAADPLLDAAFGLGDGSPMIDVGADAGLRFAGRAPDIGAYEVGLDACGDIAGEGGAGGAAGGAGTGPGGTSATGPGAGGSAATGGGPGAEGGDEGCGCAQPGRRGGSGGGLPAIAIALLLVASRRCREGRRSEGGATRGRAAAPRPAPRRREPPP